MDGVQRPALAPPKSTHDAHRMSYAVVSRIVARRLFWLAKNKNASFLLVDT